MANISVTPVKGLKNLETETAAVAATSTTADTAETFEFSSGKSFALVFSSILIGIKFEFSEGTMWAGKSGLDFTTTEKCGAYVVESAKVTPTNGKVTIKAIPASGKKLLTDHALTVTVVEL